jgi:acetolactate synthase-1/2/3 large subunit
VAVIGDVREALAALLPIDKKHILLGIMNLKKIQKIELEQVINEELKPTNNKGISMGETIEMINKL